MLPDLAKFAERAVVGAGYPGLAALMALETFFPPIPSEVVLPLAGFQVDRGHLLFAGALLAATLGAVVGSLGLYFIARIGGRPLVLRLGRVVRVTAADLDRGDRWFDQHGAKLVLFGRLLPGARSLVSLPAGLARMPVGRFCLLTAIGSGLWNAALLALGMALGSNWSRVGNVIGPASSVVVALLVAAAAAGATIAWRRRRTETPEAL